MQIRQGLVFLLFKVLIPFLFLLGANTVLFGQQSELSKSISVSYQNTSLEDVLRDIEEKSGIKFSYSSSTVPVNEKIIFSANEVSVKEILDEIFRQVKIEYNVIGGYLVLKKAKGGTVAEPPNPKVEKYTVSGIIRDSKTNETLIGAAIYNPQTGKGTLSNKYGFFSLTLPEGDYTLQTSFLGYNVADKTVELTKNIRWNVSLEAISSLMKEIIISSFDREEVLLNSRAAQNNVRAIEVENKPSALGETDMLHALGQLPGISFQNDGSSYFYVRGGNRDQNLILLDEATIYNPSHFLGLFTPIIPEAVKHSEVYKADIPVQYGGRLSSVIDVRTRDGNMQKLSGSGSVGLVSTRLSLEGPFRKERSSYFVSYRRSHLGVLVKAINPDVSDFYFSDFTTKFNFRAGKKNRVFLTLYAGEDKFIYNPEDAEGLGVEWGNVAFTLRWNHIFSEKLFLNTTFYTSKYDYFLRTDLENDIYWTSHVSSNNLKLEFTYYATPDLKFKYGGKLGAYFFNPGEYNDPNLADENTVSRVNSTELVFYGGVEHEIFDNLKINAGIRLSTWSDIGEAFTIEFDEDHNPVDSTNYATGETYYTSLNAEPRASIAYKIGKYSSLKVSYNRTVQHINLINNSISPFNSLEVWLPSGPNIEPQSADILNLGFCKSFAEKNMEFGADLYYKKMYNQVGYDYHAELLLNAFIEGEIRQGDGKAYGFEVLLKKTTGKLTGQIGYAFTRSKLKIDDLNGGREYYSRQDKPIDFSLKLNCQFKPRWRGTFNLFYGSGNRFTSPTGYYNYHGSQVPLYSEQNNDRLPGYKRIDIGTNIRLNSLDGRWEHYLTFNVYNFFNCQNPIMVNYNKMVDGEGAIVVPADKLNQASLTPTYRYVYSVWPSVTYSMKF